MPVEGLDHIAITVADVEATLDWYEQALGAERLMYDLFASGAIPVAFLQVGASRLSVHRAEAPAAPHAHQPTAGSVDVCFRWTGPIEDAAAALTAAGVEIIEGPVPRPASNGARGTSVYCRDPDGNLVELLAVDAP